MNANNTDPSTPQLRRILMVSAVGYLVSALAMTVAIAASSAPASAPESARVAAATLPLALVGFGFASSLPAWVLAFMGSTILLGTPREHRGAAGIGALFVAAYAPLSAAAYISQYTLVPWLLGRGAPAAVWSFNGDRSVPMAIDLAAYLLWGIGGCFIARGLVARGGAWRWSGWALAASGVTSIAAFPLYALDLAVAVPLSALSGVLSLGAPVAALVAVHRDTPPAVGAGGGAAAAQRR